MSFVFFERPSASELRTRGRGVRCWLRAWSPVLFALAAITVESTGGMGANHTSVWWRPWWQSIFGPVSNDRWELIHHLLRKTGHFLGYGAVCLTFLRGWLLTLAGRIDWTAGMWRLRSSLRAVGCTFLVACADEFHQSFLPSRTALFSDVLLDSCGATLMCLLAWLLIAKRE